MLTAPFEALYAVRLGSPMTPAIELRFRMTPPCVSRIVRATA